MPEHQQLRRSELGPDVGCALTMVDSSKYQQPGGLDRPDQAVDGCGDGERTAERHQPLVVQWKLLTRSYQKQRLTHSESC
jgi:hypothetical protein